MNQFTWWLWHSQKRLFNSFHIRIDWLMFFSVAKSKNYGIFIMNVHVVPTRRKRGKWVKITRKVYYSGCGSKAVKLYIHFFLRIVKRIILGYNSSASSIFPLCMRPHFPPIIQWNKKEIPFPINAYCIENLIKRKTWHFQAVCFVGLKFIFEC